MDAKFFEPESNRCGLCSRHCVIPDGKTGFCGVRKNEGGKLKALSYGHVTAAALDPVEKKPLYHFLPSSLTFSLSSYSCNFSCLHCQNHSLSSSCDAEYYEMTPSYVVNAAKNSNAKSISFTYNEPTVSYEFVFDVCREAKKAGLKTALITNGYMSEEALAELASCLDAIRVDLKAFSDEFYKNICAAKLQPVLDTILSAREKRIHTELVTLIIPSLNDDKEELGSMLDWEVENLGLGVPHHFTAFTPMYKLTHINRTPLKTLDAAFNIAKEKGLYYPYVGNVYHANGSKTLCPECGEVLILRAGYACKTPGLLCGGKIANQRHEAMLSGAEARCKRCGRVVEGIFD